MSTPAYEILIKLEADLKAGKDVAAVLSEAKRSAAGLGGEFETTTRKTNALRDSKQRLKDAIKGLALEFPVLGRVAGLFLNPITAAVTLAIGAFAAVRRELQQFEEALEDGASTTKWGQWVKEQQRAVYELRQELAHTRGEMDRFTGFANDPERLARQRTARFTNAARRAGEADQALVGVGQMTPETAQKREADRQAALRRNLQMVEEQKVFGTTVEHEKAKLEYDAQGRSAAKATAEAAARKGLLDDAEAKLVKERESLAKLAAERERTAGNPYRMGDHFALREQELAKEKLIADLEKQLPGYRDQSGAANSRLKVEQNRLGEIESRQNSLRQRGQEDVFDRPADRGEFRRDQTAERYAAAVGKLSPEQLALLNSNGQLTKAMVDQNLKALQSIEMLASRLAKIRTQ